MRLQMEHWSRWVLWLCGPCLAGCFAGCGAEPPVVEPAPTPTAQPAPEPAPEPAVAPDAGPGDAAAEPPEELPSKPKPSGRPNILYGPSERISEPFGATPGAVIKLKAKGSKEPFVLMIPEWSLPGGYQITFELAKAVKGQEPVVGPIYKVTVQPQGKRSTVRVETRGEPFEFRVPTFGKETVHLAIGEIAVKAGKESVRWTVVAPRNVDKSFGLAYAYVGFIGPMYVHATEAAPTGGEPPPAE